MQRLQLFALNCVLSAQSEMPPMMMQQPHDASLLHSLPTIYVAPHPETALSVQRKRCPLIDIALRRAENYLH